MIILFMAPQHMASRLAARLSFANELSLGILGLYSFFKVFNSNTNFANLLDKISLGMQVGKISLIG